MCQNGEFGGIMFKATATAVIVAVLLFASLPAQAVSPSRKFADCAALNSQFPTGVVASKKLARLAVGEGYQRPRVNSKVALANDSLSPDVPYVCPISTGTQETPSQSDSEPVGQEQETGSSQSPESEESGGDETSQDTDPYYVEKDDSSIRSRVVLPDSSPGPQQIEVRISGPGQMRGRINLGRNTKTFQTNRDKEWTTVFQPNDYGIIVPGYVSVSVSRDYIRRPGWQGNLPSGKVECEIRVNGTVVSRHSKAYKTVRSARCTVLWS